MKLFCQRYGLLTCLVLLFCIPIACAITPEQLVGNQPSPLAQPRPASDIPSSPLAAPVARPVTEPFAVGPTLFVIADMNVSTLRVPPPAHMNVAAGSQRTQTANFQVNYNPSSCGGAVAVWPSAAQDAFSFAVDIWAGLIESSQTIVVDACWRTDLGPNILGAAGSTAIIPNVDNAPTADILYPVALANALAGRDYNGTNAEIGAGFNSNFPNWYLGTDGMPGREFDFVSTVLHELGHGLGFFGSMTVSGGVGQRGISGLPVIYDRFTEDGNGRSLTDYPNESTDLANALTGQVGGAFFTGTNAVRANNNSRIQLYTPNPWRQGSSYAHLAESFNETSNALMTFSLTQGEAIQDPGPIALCMFADMGWQTTCPFLPPPPTPMPTATPPTPIGPLDEQSFLPFIAR